MPSSAGASSANASHDSEVGKGRRSGKVVIAFKHCNGHAEPVLRLYLVVGASRVSRFVAQYPLVTTAPRGATASDGLTPTYLRRRCSKQWKVTNSPRNDESVRQNMIVDWLFVLAGLVLAHQPCRGGAALCGISRLHDHSSARMSVASGHHW